MGLHHRPPSPRARSLATFDVADDHTKHDDGHRWILTAPICLPPSLSLFIRGEKGRSHRVAVTRHRYHLQAKLPVTMMIAMSSPGQ
ncbi:hypothetical protein CRG98_039857 [Punica granatum]|uniref:Uncharacterized protein n=1 Tax=Punica granatum TaxID=22663 RepID=A0A2I0I764_PUNGR|nr:hypothetical protein CRG98_039857 [Punica granatum]